VALHRVKQFKDIELSYDAASGLTVKFYSDMPGGAMALRSTLSFPSSSGRRTYTAPLDSSGAYTEGTLYRVEVTSTGVARLFGGVVRARGIGVYIDGTQNERWQTQELGIGV
jgi:hypothetical protein